MILSCRASVFAKTNLYLVLADTDAMTGKNSPVALAGSEVSCGYGSSAPVGSPHKEIRPSGQIAAQPFFTQLAHGKTLEQLQTGHRLVSRGENCATMTTDRSLSLPTRRQYHCWVQMTEILTAYIPRKKEARYAFLTD